jgi:hypothetical protein
VRSIMAMVGSFGRLNAWLDAWLDA